MSNRKAKIMFYLSIVFLALNSASLFAIPKVNYDIDANNRTFSLVCSSMFWVSLIIAWVSNIVCYKRLNVKSYIDGKVGMLTFFSSKVAMLVDILCGTLLIATIIILIVSNNSTLEFSFISLFIFAFQLHCLLNSKLYKYLFNQKQEGRKNEKSNKIRF